MIKLLIFDYDGVIVDSFPNLYETYKILAEKMNKVFPYSSIEDFRKNLPHYYLQLYAQLGIGESEQVAASEIFKEETLKQNPPAFEGISEVLAELHNKYKLVLVSANYADEVKQKLEKFGIANYFDDIKGQIIHDLPVIKNEEFLKILSDNEISAEEALVIGDRDSDFYEAEKAGIKHKIIVEYGWGYNRDKLEGLRQDIFVHKPEDLIKAVEILDK